MNKKALGATILVVGIVIAVVIILLQDNVKKASYHSQVVVYPTRIVVWDIFYILDYDIILKGS